MTTRSPNCLEFNCLQQSPHLVEELPPHPVVAPIPRQSEPRYVGELRPCQVPPQPVDREAFQLDLHETREERCPTQADRRARAVPPDRAGAPGLHPELQLQVEDPAWELAQ